MAKKFIIVAAIVVSAIVGLWLIFPRSVKWERTVRCYDAFGFLDHMDASLSEIEYVDVECDFEIKYSYAVKAFIEGTVKIDGVEYTLNSGNVSIDKDWIPATVSFEAQTFLYLSSDKKHIMFWDTRRKKGSTYWIGAEENWDSIMEAAESFDLGYLFQRTPELSKLIDGYSLPKD